MINVAKTAGFCYGVKRAVDDVYKEIENGKKIATLGPLIHNRHSQRMPLVSRNTTRAHPARNSPQLRARRSCLRRFHSR